MPAAFDAKAAAVNSLLAKHHKHEDDANDWLKQVRGLTGTGVSYASAPVGAVSYSAANLK